MTRPIDEISQAIREAIAGALQDSESLLSKILASEPGVTVTGGGGGSSGGGGGGVDPISLVLGLGLIALAADPEVLAIVESLKSAAGQAGSTAEGFGSGYFLGYAAWQFAEPYMRYVTHFVENEAQSQILDPATAADMAARGVITPAFGASEAGGGGFDQQHFNDMQEAALHYPGLPETLRLWNLGYLDDTDVDLILKRQGIPDNYAAQVKQLRRQLLSVADLALGTLRGDITYDDALAYAQSLGMVKDDFDRFIFNTGEPPGIMQMLELYRRDELSKEELHRAVLQSRVRNEWFDAIVALRYERMSAADAVTATVQNHLTYDAGLKAAEVAGLDPRDFPVLYQTAGEPLSRTEMQELYNRGLATEAQVKQAARESRLKDKYVNLSFDLARRLIPYRTINTILTHGVRDHKWGIKYLMSLGYTEDDASALVGTATSAKVAHVKQVSEAQVLELYQAKAVDRKEAVKLLGDLGYAAPEADYLLEAIDSRRRLSEQNRAISFLRTGYMHDRVTEAEASAAMDKLAVPATQRDQLLTDWRIERDGQVLALTPAQVVDAVEYNIITFADAQAKLIQMGYSNNEAKILISIKLKGVPAGVTISPLVPSAIEAPSPQHGGTF